MLGEINTAALKFEVLNENLRKHQVERGSGNAHIVVDGDVIDRDVTRFEWDVHTSSATECDMISSDAFHFPFGCCEADGKVLQGIRSGNGWWCNVIGR